MDLTQPLMDAVVVGEENLIDIYLNMGTTINVKTSDGYNVLHWAAASSEGEKLVPYLIAKGIDVNSQDIRGYSPLHVHALRGRVYGVSCLLHNGADPNITTNEEKYTPLHLAIMHNQTDVISVLLSFGADPTIEPAGQSS
jgi:ankyrin repeat protein